MGEVVFLFATWTVADREAYQLPRFWSCSRSSSNYGQGCKIAKNAKNAKVAIVFLALLANEDCHDECQKNLASLALFIGSAPVANWRQAMTTSTPFFSFGQ